MMLFKFKAELDNYIDIEKLTQLYQYQKTKIFLATICSLLFINNLLTQVKKYNQKCLF